MQGNRIYDYNKAKPGDYWNNNGVWYCKPPNFTTGYRRLSKHKVIEHDDGTITVSPSIKMDNHICSWHGFLEKGIWREC